MGVVASALAYLYIVCKNKCIDMKATMCTTSCGMSALFGREDGMGGSECGALELWEWEPLKILLTTMCVTLMVSMCATSHGMSAVYGRLGPQEGGWEDQSVEPRSCGSGSLPPIPPALATSTAALCTEASILVCTSSQLQSLPII